MQPGKQERNTRENKQKAKPGDCNNVLENVISRPRVQRSMLLEALVHASTSSPFAVRINNKFIASKSCSRFFKALKNKVYPIAFFGGRVNLRTIGQMESPVAKQQFRKGDLSGSRNAGHLNPNDKPTNNQLLQRIAFVSFFWIN
eukprot:c24134_g1_i1.p1 GENE.c24134_g1_i1~~c24134_g1_i1.p1  ORF type:complete len:144 (+),score=16.19 c24134_g1_i1:252-683(+)